MGEIWYSRNSREQPKSIQNPYSTGGMDMRGLLIISLLLVSACTDSIKDERVNASSGPTTPGAATSEGDADAQADDGGNQIPAAGGNPNPTLATLLPVAYTQDLEPMVSKLCTAACHKGAGTTGTPLLNSFELLKTAAKGAVAAIDAGRMPLGLAKLGDADKLLLAQLSVSLKNWAKDGSFADDISDYKITYDGFVSNVAKGLCIGCHSGDAPKAGLRLTTQEEWKAAMPKILTKVGNNAMPPKIDAVQGPRLLKFLTEWQSKGFP
jgi:hypothetical protein